MLCALLFCHHRKNVKRRVAGQGWAAGRMGGGQGGQGRIGWNFEWLGTGRWMRSAVRAFDTHRRIVAVSCDSWLPFAANVILWTDGLIISGSIFNEWGSRWYLFAPLLGQNPHF